MKNRITKRTNKLTRQLKMPTKVTKVKRKELKMKKWLARRMLNRRRNLRLHQLKNNKKIMMNKKKMEMRVKRINL